MSPYKVSLLLSLFLYFFIITSKVFFSIENRVEKEVFSPFFLLCVYGHAVGALRINKKILPTDGPDDDGLKAEEKKKLRFLCAQYLLRFPPLLSLYPQRKKKRKSLLYLVGLIAPSSFFSFYSPHPTTTGVPPPTRRAYYRRRPARRSIAGWAKEKGVGGTRMGWSVVVSLYVLLHPSLTHLVEAQSLTGRRSASTVFHPSTLSDKLFVSCVFVCVLNLKRTKKFSHNYIGRVFQSLIANQCEVVRTERNFFLSKNICEKKKKKL